MTPPTDKEARNGFSELVQRVVQGRADQRTFEEAKEEWKGSHPYSYKRHSWVQRENICPGSKESPAPDSVRMFNATTGAMKRTRRGKCSVCGKDSHVSKQGTISTHKARV